MLLLIRQHQQYSNRIDQGIVSPVFSIFTSSYPDHLKLPSVFHQSSTESRIQTRVATPHLERKKNQCWSRCQRYVANTDKFITKSKCSRHVSRRQPKPSSPNRPIVVWIWTSHSPPLDPRPTAERITLTGSYCRRKL